MKTQISLHILPSGNIIELVYDMLRRYGQENDILVTRGYIRRILKIHGYRFFYIYKNNAKVGIVSCMVQDKYLIGDMVYLYPRHRLYFSKVIEQMETKASNMGLRGIITNPNERTAKIYDKHKIGVKISWA